MRFVFKFSLAAIFALILSMHFMHLAAQGQSDKKVVVETSWVKFALPSGWTVTSNCPTEYDSKGIGEHNRDYLYKMAVHYIREPFASAIFTKIFYPDGSAMTVEDGKKHFENHAPGLLRCMWYKSSANEAKALAIINSVGFANGAMFERNVYATIFVRKVANDVHILEIKFEDTTPTDNRKPIIDAIYNSWQPIVKNNR